MTKSNLLFIGMDVHKESIEIAIADDGAYGEVRRWSRLHCCRTLSDPKETRRQITQRGGGGHRP